MRKNEDLSGFLQNVKSICNDIFADTHIVFNGKKELYKLFPEIIRRIDDVIRNIENSTPILDAILNDCGLTGEQLKIKIKFFNEAYSQWSFHKSIKTLLRLLKWVDLILGSIARAMPLCESIKEFKEMIELKLITHKEKK